MNENVLESDFEPLCDGTRSIADLTSRFVIVSGNRQVLSLWLFYMQAPVAIKLQAFY